MQILGRALNEVVLESSEDFDPLLGARPFVHGPLAESGFERCSHARREGREPGDPGGGSFRRPSCWSRQSENP